MRCRWLILATAAAFGALACSKAELTDADLVALGAVGLRAELAAGRVSALRVTQAYLRRIAELDDAGPSLGAVIEINPDAEAIARALDTRFRDGTIAGPLHGVPVLVKANIDTADEMATSAGSVALAEHRAPQDADVVAQLRAAGAVLLGKTNLSEWANFRSDSSTSGWSSLGGQTHNAYVLDRNPCGSSSGSAVAVAARLAPLAVGTETDGSIVCPAAANGIVGVKPTIGTVSQRGIIPIAHSQDTAGPMARTAADAALLLAVLGSRGAPLPASGEREGATGLRVGVVRNFTGAGRDSAAESTLTQAIAWLVRANAVIVDPVDAALPQATEDAEFEILLGEFRADLDAYLAGVERGPRSLTALVEYNAAHAAEVMPFFGQELFIAARDSEGMAGSAYAAAQSAVATAREGLAELFAERNLDALIAPTNSRAWRTDLQAGDEFRVGSSSIAAVTGYPSVTVPVALVGELPLGVSLIGKPDDESLLLLLAAAIEEQRGPFPEPRFLPSIDE
jgi:amidase